MIRKPGTESQASCDRLSEGWPTENLMPNGKASFDRLSYNHEFDEGFWQAVELSALGMIFVLGSMLALLTLG